MRDNKRTVGRYVTPNRVVMERISEKFAGISERTVIEPETEISQELQQVEKTSSQKVKESLNNKLETMFALRGRFEGKYVASKYLGKSISDIMSEERRVNNLIEEIEERLNSLIKEFSAPYRKAGRRLGGWDEERIELYVTKFVADNLIGTGATEPDEIEAHKKYMKLRDELAQAKAEKNAIAVAKADYMEQNADLIREAQENKRRKEFEESGLLEELGIVKPDPAKAEEKSKEIEEKVEESEEQEDESNISE